MKLILEDGSVIVRSMGETLIGFRMNNARPVNIEFDIGEVSMMLAKPDYHIQLIAHYRQTLKPSKSTSSIYD